MISWSVRIGAKRGAEENVETSRALTRSAVAPVGRITLLFILVVLCQNAGVTFVGWVVCKFVGSESAAFGVSGFLLLHIGTSPGDGTAQLTNRVGAALFHVSSLVS